MLIYAHVDLSVRSFMLRTQIYIHNYLHEYCRFVFMDIYINNGDLYLIYVNDAEHIDF